MDAQLFRYGIKVGEIRNLQVSVRTPAFGTTGNVGTDVYVIAVRRGIQIATRLIRRQLHLLQDKGQIVSQLFGQGFPNAMRILFLAIANRTQSDGRRVGLDGLMQEGKFLGDGFFFFCTSLECCTRRCGIHRCGTWIRL